MQTDPDKLLAAFDALPAAEPLRERLGSADRDVYLVGGAVRDLILGLPPRELDLLVESAIGQVMDQLEVSGTKHDRFGTAQLRLDGFTYDLAQARGETYEQPGALPTVSPAGLDEDLGRRDFTINAVALGVFGAARGIMRALPGALTDLEQRRLRILHDQSFIDDPTRLMRLALYAGRLGFHIDRHTEALARAAVAAGALGTVSGNRLGAELRRMASEPDPIAPLQALHDLGIDEALAPGFGLADPGPARAALVLLPEEDGDPAALAVAAAGVDVQPEWLAQLLDRLAFEAGQRDRILVAASRARSLGAQLAQLKQPSKIAAAIGSAGPEAVALAGAYGGADAARRWLSELRHVKLQITGTDLLGAGVPSGPDVGRALRAARAAKLDGMAPTREAELTYALAAANSERPISLDAHASDDA